MNLTPELAKLRDEIEGYARDCGLDFYKVIFEVLDWKQINEVAALGGFPNRYPHWRFGMEYENISKRYAYGLSKIYEMVINNDPCYAYLLYCNNIVDQKLVMAHVYAHCDFFKNNIYFAHTNRKMMDEMANHRSRIMRYINRYGHDVVEDFIDACLSIDSLIDIHAPAIRRIAKPKVKSAKERVPAAKKIKSKPYMDKYINPPDFLKAQRDKMVKERDSIKNFPVSPVRDIASFLQACASLEPWERDILSMIIEEAYYFAPQGQTKILNEGWACVAGDTLIHTDRGWLRADEIATKRIKARVNDGEDLQDIYDWAIFENKKAVHILTRRGIKICGSTTHQIVMEDGSWRKMEDINPGDKVKLFLSSDLWPKEYVDIDWEPERGFTLTDIADQVGVNLSTVIRHKTGKFHSRSAEAIEEGMHKYEALRAKRFICNNRNEIKVPERVDEELAEFLGYLVGDGHISRIKRVIGLTSADYDQVEKFAKLGAKLFGLKFRIKKDGGRYRALFHSEYLSDFLEYLGLKTGVAARCKEVPSVILRSPKSVVAAFIRAYFDCDAYAGEAGIKLSTSSWELCDKIQLLLLNFGILSSKNKQPKDILHLNVFGSSAKKYLEEIGFNLDRKTEKLCSYLTDRQWFKKENFDDEVVSVRYGKQDVYDFSVRNTHKYVAAGLINHNSLWHSRIMTKRALDPNEFIDYADHHSGTLATQPGQLNPYKIGIELFRDIEDRWNKGRFGKEYDDCTDYQEKKNWDKKLGLGKEKIFEVRKLYSDVMFIDEFLTPEFCRENKLFVYAYNLSSDQFEIADRNFQSIKEKLLFFLTNAGRPTIDVIDGNYGNRSELLLKHKHAGVDLRIDYAKETLKNLFRIWKKPVNIETIFNGTPKVICYDGENYKEFRP